MFKLPFRNHQHDITSSRLFDETTFYKQFIDDLNHAKTEVIIESPFITSKRMNYLSSIFQKLIDKLIKIYIVTRDPDEHDNVMREQAETEIQWFERMGVQALITKNNGHRKLAIIDRKILWEGSLNILSQSNSRELMRRIQSEQMVQECLRFTKLEKYI